MNIARSAWPKPLGGFWTAPDDAYAQLLERRGELEGRPEWITTAREAPRYVLTVNPSARILVVDSLYDARSFTGMDFMALRFMGYDGIHYTENAARTNLLRDWECESVFWMRWCFDEVKRIR